MQSQVLRCKAIVTGILRSAGEARAEAPAQTTLHRFLDDMVDDWREARATDALRYDNRFGADVAIVSDSALRQMIGNVLDNALEASPGWLALAARRERDDHDV